MNLPEKILAKINSHAEKGNNFIDNEQYDSAIAEWSKALDILPEPKNDWEAYAWLSASIGDALYHKKAYRLAAISFLNSLNAPGGTENPFVHYRLGQCYILLEDESSGVEALLKAYMLDGEEIFLEESDGITFLNILRDKDLVD
ncbi:MULTISPECIES: tetratricopeptide repeat protein [Pseudomonas]|uniref:tetratricopeptide repeat protein n=1 Tax=Pseudomonas TaxID=286 RepID=UPI000762222C|nr:hypothetical protein [Pseudomonas monteilii]